MVFANPDRVQGRIILVAIVILIYSQNNLEQRTGLGPFASTDMITLSLAYKFVQGNAPHTSGGNLFRPVTVTEEGQCFQTHKHSYMHIITLLVWMQRPPELARAGLE